MQTLVSAAALAVEHRPRVAASGRRRGPQARDGGSSRAAPRGCWEGGGVGSDFSDQRANGIDPRGGGDRSACRDTLEPTRGSCHGVATRINVSTGTPGRIRKHDPGQRRRAFADFRRRAPDRERQKCAERGRCWRRLAKPLATERRRRGARSRADEGRRGGPLRRRGAARTGARSAPTRVLAERPDASGESLALTSRIAFGAAPATSWAGSDPRR